VVIVLCVVAGVPNTDSVRGGGSFAAPFDVVVVVFSCIGVGAKASFD
jgi:hypothetical protein